MSTTLEDRLAEARRTSRRHHGRTLTFFLPGMFRLDGRTGKYPALSVTGRDCAFSCEHCKGVLLKTMLPCPSPDELLARARELKARGNHGILVSGGCDGSGQLPWARFAPALRRIKAETGLIVSVHAGFPDARQAELLKEAGVDQVLVDVIGDDGTLSQVYHAPFGVERVRETLRVLRETGLALVPHVVCGLHFGRLAGERRALEMIAESDPQALVIVSLSPLPGTPLRGATPPRPEEVAEIIAEARFLMPQVPISLGCARARGSRVLEKLAIDAGVNRLALPSPDTVDYAKAAGLRIRFQKTCCSVGADLAAASWDA